MIYRLIIILAAFAIIYAVMMMTSKPIEVDPEQKERPNGTETL
jgi:hypothetical protein